MKRVKVKVIPNAKRNEIREGEGPLKVYLTAPREKGKANKALILLLSKYFRIKKGDIKIISGERETRKIIEVGGIYG